MVRSLEDIATIRDDWAALYAECPDRKFCHDPYWCTQMWARTEGTPGREPLVIIGSVGGHCRLIWPLVTYRQRLWRVTQAMSEDLSDFDDILVAPDPHADSWRKSAWDYMLVNTQPDMVVCRRVPENSGLDLQIGTHLYRWEKASSSPYIDFRKEADWDSFFHRVSNKLRISMRRGGRWITRTTGPVRFDEVSDQATADRLIDWMLRQKHNRLGSHVHSKREKLTYTHFGQDMPFLRDVASHAFRDGSLRVLHLAAGDQTVGVNTVLVTGKRMVGWLSAYDPHFNQASPGHIVLKEGLEWAYGQGAETFDLMPEPEAHKFKWTQRVYGVRDVRIATSSWGRVLVTWYRSPVRRLLVAVYMHLPKPVQRLIRRMSS